jgi:hypothetical protein
MPLSDDCFGTNKDQSINHEYCKYCFLKGEFTQIDLTCDQMIKESANHMIKELKMPPSEAQKLANLFIPTLKRWHE